MFFFHFWKASLSNWYLQTYATNSSSRHLCSYTATASILCPDPAASHHTSSATSIIWIICLSLWFLGSSLHSRANSSRTNCTLSNNSSHFGTFFVYFRNLGGWASSSLCSIGFVTAAGCFRYWRFKLANWYYLEYGNLLNF